MVFARAVDARGAFFVRLRSTKRFGAIAQLVERYNGIVEVAGSNPAGSTKALA